MPALSILMPVYNALPHLATAMRSLERQTVSDIEIIAVDDGSTDGSGEWLDRAAVRNPRLTVVHAAHAGLPTALNLALTHARAPLIGRHDADDISRRRRFEIQLAHMRRHPRVAVLGARLRLFPDAIVRDGMRRWAAWHNQLLDHASMARELLIDSPLAHGTAVIRRDWLERVGGWHERGWAEDLDLWIRLIEAGARFDKRSEVLYAWRQHRASATWCDPRYHRDRFVDLKLDALARGFLRHASCVTVVGVGDSLARATEAIGRRCPGVRAVRRGRPSPEALRVLEPPAVLVFMSPVSRERWRSALARVKWVEGTDFVFAI